MFKSYSRTLSKPQKPLLIWDGACGFCKYWVTVWQQQTENRVEYKTYQEVAQFYPEIPTKEFKKASRLIDEHGSIYSGPDSAYKSLTYYKKPLIFLHFWYHRYDWFKSLSNHAYNIIAKNRPSMMRVTVLLWGRNPRRQKPYWIFWLLGVGLLLAAIFTSL